MPQGAPVSEANGYSPFANIAIVIAGALIAAAIALTNRWTLHSQVLVRMDNWTGTVEWVNPRR
jgi:hypothetical protein